MTGTVEAILDKAVETYLPGPVYQAVIFMGNGMIVSSTALSATKCQKFLDGVADSAGMRKELRHIGHEQARELLTAAMDEWKMLAIALSLAPGTTPVGAVITSDQAMKFAREHEQQLRALAP